MQLVVDNELASTCQLTAMVPLPIPHTGDEAVTNLVFRAKGRDDERYSLSWHGQWIVWKGSRSVARKTNLISALSELERHSGVPANQFRAV